MKIIGSSVNWSTRHQFSREESHSRIAHERAVQRPAPELNLRSLPDRQPRVQPPSPAPQAARPHRESKDQETELTLDADVMRLKALVEALIGRKIDDPICIRETTPSCEGVDTTQSPAVDDPPTTPDNTQYETTIFSQHYVSEYEYSSVNIAGTFVLAGKGGAEQYLDIELSVSMERYYEASSSELIVRQGRLTDPLVVNFTPQPVSLSSTTTLFDLDSDGQAESIPTLNEGSAYLARDIDGDGAINNGSELFGPSSGDGFTELAQYDLDGNGFIDSGDPIYEQLQVYRPSDNSLQSLQSTGIQALYTGAVESPFRLTDGDNNTLGQVRSTGFYLNEDNSPGSLQQIDLKA